MVNGTDAGLLARRRRQAGGPGHTGHPRGNGSADYPAGAAAQRIVNRSSV